MSRPTLTGRGAVAGAAAAALVAQHALLRRRQAAAEELVREHTALREVAGLVAYGAELPALCARVARLAAELVDGEVGLVLQFEAERGLLVGRWVRSIRDYPDSGEELRFEPDSAIGGVLRTGHTTRVAPGTPSPFREDLGERVATPISLGGCLWGAVAVAGTRAAPLPARADHRLESFAELVAVAIGNAEARAQLETQAMTDPLTGVANRRAFNERLEAEFQRARRHHRSLSLIVFDVDRFKAINDSAGHVEGDAVLVEVAQRVQASLRADSLLGRLGGDEFAALLPECDPVTARHVAERAVCAVSAGAVGIVTEVAVSAGVAELRPADDSPDALYRRADADLYQAKGRARAWRGSNAA